MIRWSFSGISQPRPNYLFRGWGVATTSAKKNSVVAVHDLSKLHRNPTTQSQVSNYTSIRFHPTFNEAFMVYNTNSPMMLTFLSWRLHQKRMSCDVGNWLHASPPTSTILIPPVRRFGNSLCYPTASNLDERPVEELTAEYKTQHRLAGHCLSFCIYI